MKTSPAITSVTLAYDMMQRDLERHIFSGVGTSTPVGLRERFSDEVILSLLNHPCWNQFDQGFQDWIWNAIDSCFDTVNE